MLKRFTVLSSILHNYFHSPIKLFSELYLAKFLDISANFFREGIYLKIIEACYVDF